MKLEDVSVLASPEEIHDGAIGYFKKFLTKENEREQLVLGHLLSKFIAKDENNRMLARPMEVELKDVVISIPIDRSPRLDGFGSGFFLACWEFIKPVPSQLSNQNDALLSWMQVKLCS